jgi:uncharacterized FlaG/YvyC family protein
MASDGNPVKIPAASLVHGSQAQRSVTVQERSGKTLPPSGRVLHGPAAHAAPKTQSSPSVEELIAQLNKHVNNSGRPEQYRVDPNSDNKVIQQVNPATGEVVGEFLASEFPALARSVGLSGALVNSRA